MSLFGALEYLIVLADNAQIPMHGPAFSLASAMLDIRQAVYSLGAD